MYKFTNGFIAYDKETAENLIKVGYKLIEDKKEDKKEENDENSNSDKSISTEHSRSKRESTAIQK